MSTPTLLTCGPSFPVPAMALDKGMTLRDWFAGQALPAVIQCINSAPGNQPQDGQTYLEDIEDDEADGSTLGSISYKIADAMLAASSPARPAALPSSRFGDEALELLRRGFAAGVFDDAPVFSEDVRALLNVAGKAGVA